MRAIASQIWWRTLKMSLAHWLNPMIWRVKPIHRGHFLNLNITRWWQRHTNGRVLMSTPQREKRSRVWLLMGVSDFACGRSRHNISLVVLRKHPPNTLRNFSECFFVAHKSAISKWFDCLLGFHPSWCVGGGWFTLALNGWQNYLKILGLAPPHGQMDYRIHSILKNIIWQKFYHLLIK
jgi:hypothetical protein